MEYVQNFGDLIFHLDDHLNLLAQEYGAWLYVILFLIIFCETGLVITPFLPGDSLLFALGALAAAGVLKMDILFPVLLSATLSGDTVNYWAGYFIGPKVFQKERSRFLNRKYLDRAHQFYERHGGKMITIARFVPVIRTFAPFIAGIARMTYWRFFLYSFLGGLFWISLLTCGGYFFGNLPFIKQNFALTVLAIVLISLLPAAIEVLNQQRQKKQS
ncbi:membrane-associated protein [Hydrogenispora ethanolica]|uniref:Membrane-associated protein n=1 Tax=Hydrogenispora ethanolica TaxID=1082276 RepID=A0A4R1RBA0_HYDET|nr:DedA family protein [Hydrogenispora ethanolica]TCL63016.1 membrane-associated protein [Hydrogenispora ethanolica]